MNARKFHFATRRQALALFPAAMLLGHPKSLHSQSVEPTLNGLHLEIAERVKRLRMGPNVALRLLLPKGCEDNVLPVVGEFRTLADVNVVIDWVDVDAVNERLMLDHMAGAARYDVALPASFGLPDLAAAGIILNMQPFSERHEPPELARDELYTVGNYYRGQRFGFQTDGDVYVMFYNRPWMEDEDNKKRYSDRFGEELAIAKTWHELDRQMAFFHDPDHERYGGALFRNPGYLVWEWWLRFHAKGGLPFTDDAYPAIASQKGVDALIELMSATRFLHPECKTAGLFRNWEIFSEGRCFANIGWGGTQKYLNSRQSAIRGNLAFGSTPGEMVDGELTQASYFNWGWNYAVVSTAAEPELAYLFALFASAPAMSILSVRGETGFFDPFRAEHYDDEVIRETYTEPFLDVHRQSMQRAIPDLYIRGHAQLMAALKENILQAINASMTPKQALEKTAKEWRLITIENGLDDTKAQWRYLLSQYPDLKA